jgi:hypothetical protein
VTSSFASAVLHFCLVLLLAFWMMPMNLAGRRPRLEATFEKRSAPPPPQFLTEVEPKAPPERKPAESPSLASVANRFVPNLPQTERQTASTPVVRRSTSGPPTAPIGDLLTALAGTAAGMLDSRGSELKGILLKNGGTPESEAAVERGLHWLAAHQRADGGWHFDHTFGQGCELCSHPGNNGSKSAATGLALLAFLGAGNTHLKGPHAEVVRKGLTFLQQRIIDTQFGGDLQDGTSMYSQAIATLALCEAYAMSGDRSLDRPARKTIEFIINAQDKRGGGWRYNPGQVGDTSVTGWMLPALKSAQLSYIPVPNETWQGAWRFLDHVQEDSGSVYGYQGPNRKDATMTAVGLLCRMYQGWPRRSASIGRGVRLLSRRGPSETDLYYNYYAAQVLRHYGGEEWIDWNEKLREYLIRTQQREGHEFGSWYFPDRHGDHGGRHYNTAMAVLTLEVYYRYLPIYGAPVLGEDFSK